MATEPITSEVGSGTAGDPEIRGWRQVVEPTGGIDRQALDRLSPGGEDRGEVLAVAQERS